MWQTCAEDGVLRALQTPSSLTPPSFAPKLPMAQSPRLPPCSSHLPLLLPHLASSTAQQAVPSQCSEAWQPAPLFGLIPYGASSGLALPAPQWPRAGGFPGVWAVYNPAAMVSLHCLIRQPPDTCGDLNINSLKFNKMRSSVPQSH